MQCSVQNVEFQLWSKTDATISRAHVANWEFAGWPRSHGIQSQRKMDKSLMDVTVIERTIDHAIPTVDIATDKI